MTFLALFLTPSPPAFPPSFDQCADVLKCLLAEVLETKKTVFSLYVAVVYFSEFAVYPMSEFLTNFMQKIRTFNGDTKSTLI